MGKVERLEEILRDAGHPMYMVNVAYQEFGQALQEFHKANGSDMSPGALRILSLSAYTRYIEEKQKLIDRGERCIFCRLPEPWVGYLDLDELART